MPAEPIDYLARAEELVPLVRQHADEAERRCRVSKPVAEALARAGLYRVAAPRALGGAEADPRVQIRVIETISAADGGTGWALMIGIESLGLAAPAFEPEAAREVYGDPSVILSGALNPVGRARREGAGYRVTGRWPFASGVHNSHYFYGQCIVVDGEGKPLPAPRAAGGSVDGIAQAPIELCEVLVPARDFEILETWDVSGLRGSGSHDVRVDDLYVPDSHVTHVQTARPRVPGALFSLPPFLRLAYNKVGVATGIARAAIDHFHALAAEKRPRASTVPLRERPNAHRALADAERTLRSARAFVFEVVGEAWERAQRGEKVDVELRALVQLACSHAATASIDAVAPLVEAAGTSVNFTSSPLGRCWRDVQVVRQHIMVSPQWIEPAGRALFGLPSGSPFF